jgi:DNA-binding MarR family transcriptional regulator
MSGIDEQLPIEQQIVAAIRQIVRAVDLQSRRLVENFGLTGPQLATLQAIRRLHPVSPSAIARAVHLSQGTVTGILYRLEKRGLVERSRNEIDGRGFIINITAEGRRLLDLAPSLLQDAFRTRLERLEHWERHQILSMLQRVAYLMDAQSLDASPHFVSDSIDASGECGATNARRDAD